MGKPRHERPARGQGDYFGVVPHALPMGSIDTAFAETEVETWNRRFQTMTRHEAVARRTDFVVIRALPGSKAAKARAFGVAALHESHFLELLHGRSAENCTSSASPGRSCA